MLRQEETKEISKKVQTMIIIGGKNSSNTKKIYDIAKKYCTTFLIENVKELDIKSIKDKKTIGIMAGASTPKETIQEVVEIIKKIW